MARALGCAAVVLTVLIGVIADARGATVESAQVCDEMSRCTIFTRFQATPGETNDLTVAGNDGPVLFVDPGARLRASGDCHQLGPHRVRCPRPRLDPARVFLEDGNDHYKVRGNSEIAADGGSGDDRMLGSGKSFDTMDGGSGNDFLRGLALSDTLTGGAGRDTVIGGPGSDRLADGETDPYFASPDYYDGGPNPKKEGDWIDYSTRSVDLTVDLTDSKWSAEDRYIDIESAFGGTGNDRLTAPARGGGVLGGGYGDDVLIGSDARDVMLGGPGADVLDARGGDDLVMGYRASIRYLGSLISLQDDLFGADRLLCGNGSDLTTASPVDFVDDGCETTVFQYHEPALRPTITGNQARFVVDNEVELDGTIELRGPAGEPFGTAPVVYQEDAKASIATVTLTPAAVSALAGGVVVEVNWLDGDGKVDAGYRVMLRSP